MMAASFGPVAVALAVGTPVSAQEPPRALYDSLAEVRGEVMALGPVAPDLIWPGFRPDTIPLMFVVRDRGTMLFGWRDELPNGFRPIPGAEGAAWSVEADPGAASTGVTLEGRRVAQVATRGADPAGLFGIAVHEAFHVFEGSHRRDGTYFGRGENSFLVTRYPIFDERNETEVALEGRMLAAVLRADPNSDTRPLAWTYVAVREARSRRLGATLTEFESLAEMNEGLATYAQLRALRWVTHRPMAWSRDAARAASDQLAPLDSLIADRGRSFRERFYLTGAAQGLVLDRIDGPEWKRRLMAESITLLDLVAEGSGYREREAMFVAQAVTDHGGEEVARAAAGVVASRRRVRRARVDSALAAPGVVVQLSRAGGSMGMCGIDPQNLLQVDNGLLLHTRWLRPCTGGFQGEFNAPVVHDQGAGTFTAVIGLSDEVRVTVEGTPVPLNGDVDLGSVTDVQVVAPGFQAEIARADLSMRGRTLRLVVTGQ